MVFHVFHSEYPGVAPVELPIHEAVLGRAGSTVTGPH